MRKVVGLLMPHGDPIVARGPARASLAGAASGRQNWVDPRSGVPVSLLALLLALLAPTLVGAQVVRGRAVSAETGAPIPRAIVELRRGEWSARTTTSASGAFTLAADGPGRYTLRVAAIGFSPSTLDRLVVPAGTLDAGDVMLSRVAFTLPELRVDAPSACQVSPGSGTVLGQVLDGARTALQVMEAGLGDGEYRVERVVRRAVRGRRDSLITADTTRGQFAGWPIRAVAPDSLREFGFAVELPAYAGGGRRWFGPDVGALFADWFLGSHCFSLEPDRGDDAPIRLRFEPATAGRAIDVAGVFELDRETLALRHFRFEHRNLPRGFLPGVAGGEMAFAVLPSGAWLPVRWVIRAPIENTEGRVAGELRQEGRVISSRAGTMDNE